MFSKSFTLIEAVIALFLLIVGTVGAFSLIQRTIAFSAVTSARFVATYLAQEGVEIVRNFRDTNYLQGLAWDFGLTGCGSGCEIDYNDSAFSSWSDRLLKVDDSALFNYESGTDSLYKRRIIIAPNAGAMDVAVEVSWTERGRSHEVTAQTKLYNWR